MSVMWVMTLIPLALAALVALQSSTPAVREGLRASTGNAAPLVGEQAELCGRAVELRCTSRLPRISIDIDGRDSHHVVALPESLVAEVAADFDARYQGREICATGAYRTYGPGGDGIALTDPSALRIVAEPAESASAFVTETVSACEPGVTAPLVIREVHANYTSDAMHAKIAGAVLLEGVV